MNKIIFLKKILLLKKIGGYESGKRPDKNSFGYT